MEKIYNNTSEISINELIEYKSQNPNKKITIQNPNKSSDKLDSYSLDDMIEIKKKIAEIVDGLPKDLDNPDKEKKIFTYLYTRLAHLIEYDEFASSTVGLGGYARDMSEKYRTNASNLIGGLLQGKSMCGGYSEILRNVLSEVGIESIYISGEGKDKLGNHAWNQVKLDGKWYNVDLTNDRDNILDNTECQYFLKSDSEFKRYKQYDVKSETLHQCDESVQNPDQLLETHKFVPPIVNPKSIAEADKQHNLTTSIVQNAKRFITKLLDRSKSNIEK